MPNWNTNRLTIDRITPAFKEWLAHEGGFSFERIDPTPPDKLDDNSYANGWFNWRVEQWGTKWDVEYPQAIADSLLAGEQAHFDTAWSPPMAAIDTLSKMFPDIEFRLDYYEGGDWFAGSAIFFDGLVEDTMLEEDDDIKAFARAVFNEEFDTDEENEEQEELMEELCSALLEELKALDANGWATLTDGTLDDVDVLDRIATIQMAINAAKAQD